MEYKKTISSNYQVHSKDLLLELEHLIREKLDSDNINFSISVTCEHRGVEKQSFDELFEIKDIKENFDKISFIYIRVSDNNSNNRINITILNKIEYNNIDFSIYSNKEDFCLGIYEIFNKFIQNKFLKPIEMTTIKNTAESNSNVKIINKTKTTKIKKTLDKNLISLSLNTEDFKELEGLILQDIENIRNYTIKATPTEKYLNKKQNADEYCYNSIQEFNTDENLLNNINNYIIKIELDSKEIQISIRLVNDLFISSYLKTSGENQTLYYGKFALLEKFLNSKKPWYFPFYIDFLGFTYIFFTMILSMSCLMTFLKYLFKLIFYWKILLILLAIIFINLFALKALPKIRFQLKENPKWYQNKTFQFFVMTLLGIITVVVTILK